MPLKKTPFQSYKLEEERAKDKRETFTVSINQEERTWLEQAKLALDLRSDSKALKVLAEAGKNVLFLTIGPKILRYLTKKERSRYSDFKDIDRQFKENVLPDLGEE